MARIIIGEGTWSSIRANINSMYQELMVATAPTTTSVPTTTIAPTTTATATTTIAPTTTSSGAYSAEYQAVYNSFSTKPDASVATAQNALVSSLISGGVWNKLDLFYVFANNASDNALKNWKNPGTYDCTIVAGPAFTAYEGFTGNGSSSYLNSNWNASTNSINFSKDAATIGAYMRLDENPTGHAAIGVLTNDVNNRIVLYPRYTGYFDGGINAANSVSKIVANSYGMYILSRIDAANQTYYKNGVDLGDASLASSNIPNRNITFLQHDGGVNGFSSNQISMGFIGGLFTDADVNTMTLAVKTYMTSNGLIYGPELLTNGTFDTNITGWSGSNWAWSASYGGSAQYTGVGADTFYRTASIVSGTTYHCTIKISGMTGGSVRVTPGTSGGTARSADGTYEEDVLSGADGLVRCYLTSGFNGYIEYVSVKEVL